MRQLLSLNPRLNGSRLLCGSAKSGLKLIVSTNPLPPGKAGQLQRVRVRLARMLITFCSPSRYVQGAHATAMLGEQLRHVGLTGPVLIVASTRTRHRLAAIWQTTLGSHNIDFDVHEFGGECSQPEIDAGIAAAHRIGATVVVGAGGGKTLDTSRAIAGAIGAATVNCPTAASSDAPCSALSVIYTPAGVFDRLQFYNRNPDLVLVDTTLIAEAPRRLLVSGMGDALATWYEARTVIEAHGANQVGGATGITAAALALLCRDTLFADGLAAATAVAAGVVTPALDRVVEANTLLSGLGFESGGLSVAHSVYNGLTAASASEGFLHGEKVAFGLLVQLVLEGRPQAEFDQVVQFCRNVGLPTTLADLDLGDIDSDTLREVAKRAVAPGETAHHEPFPVTADMIIDAIIAADRLGQGARATTDT